MDFKKNIYNLLRTTLFRPKYIIYCSQTLHQSMLAFCKLFDLYNNKIWADYANLAFNRIKKIQHNDGGFDIGYNFNFGSMHKRGEPTTPEMLTLVAIKKYKAVFKKTEFYNPEADIIIEKAEEWINKFVWQDGCYYKIPYSPYSDKKIVVNNGISFAAGAIGMCLDPKNENIYLGLCRFIHSCLYKNKNNQYIWYYFNDEHRKTVSNELRDKIDYYHMAQQLEMHSYAQQTNPLLIQESIINSIQCTLINHFAEKDSYTLIENVPIDSGRIHVWALSSIIPAYIESYKITGQFVAVERAVNIYNYLKQKSYNGSFFVPVLDANGNHWDTNYYVRSEAWCMHAMASIIGYLPEDEIHFCKQLIEETASRIINCDFSGEENHASNWYRELLKKILFRIRKIK